MVVGLFNLPNQRHRIVSNRGGVYNLLLVGESGLGKTTFVSTLLGASLSTLSNGPISVSSAELQEKGFNVLLNVVSSPGFGDRVNNAHCWEPVVTYIDQQHQLWLEAEQGSSRANLKDTRIHAALYFIRPSHTLSALDIAAMKEISTRVNLIPIVAKADTITPSEMTKLKLAIRACISEHSIRVYTPPVEEDDSELMAINATLEATWPFSVIGSEYSVNLNGKSVRGREYRWGVAQAHCDFGKLVNLLIKCHMSDLIESTHSLHYEDYRARTLTSQGLTDDHPANRAKKNLMAKMKEDEEELRKKFTEQVRVEENRFRQWEQNLISERDRLNKDLEEHHRLVKELEREYELLHEEIKNTSR